MRRIAVVIVDRANYGRLKCVIEEIETHPALELQLILGGTTVLPRFKFNCPHEVAGRCHTLIEGNDPLAAALSMGVALGAYARELSRLSPDLVLIIGDKFDATSAGLAAVNLGIPVCHFQGGEISGCYDDIWRKCLTCTAVYHVPATRLACERVLSLAGGDSHILGIGCPSADLAARVGSPPRGGRILVCYHPDTAARNVAFHDEMISILDACKDHPLDVMWPNADAGSDQVSKAIRQWKGTHDIQTHINVPPQRYLQMLATARCCVGNSSSFVRDAGYFGTPVLLIGTRQAGREHGRHVWRLEADGMLIRHSIEKLKEYPPSDLYGKPGISKQVVERIAAL